MHLAQSCGHCRHWHANAHKRRHPCCKRRASGSRPSLDCDGFTPSDQCFYDTSSGQLAIAFTSKGTIPINAFTAWLSSIGAPWWSQKTLFFSMPPRMPSYAAAIGPPHHKRSPEWPLSQELHLHPTGHSIYPGWKTQPLPDSKAPTRHGFINGPFQSILTKPATKSNDLKWIWQMTQSHQWFLFNVFVTKALPRADHQGHPSNSWRTCHTYYAHQPACLEKCNTAWPWLPIECLLKSRQDNILSVFPQRTQEWHGS